ncbi:MAG: hypothetical protein IKC15_05820 [Kiritimatiellae bacterium]|nr:hypothetical protein [Kiritimatiellia bacterium]
MEVDGVSLTMGGAAVTALAGVAGAYIKAKFGKTQIPQPMETSQVGPFVTCGECKQHRAAIGKRIDTIETSTRTIINKLDEIDTRAEQRSENLHRRLDPIIEKVAANSAKVDMIENTVREAAKAATIGGKT